MPFTPTLVNIGSAANSGNGEPLRNAFSKINTNLTSFATVISEIDAAQASAVSTVSAAAISANSAKDAAIASAAAALESEENSLQSQELAALFAQSPRGETFSIGDTAYLSAKHYAEVAADYALQTAYIPKRDATSTELTAGKVTVGSTDLFTTISVNNSSGNVAVEVSPSIWSRPQGDREAWLRVRRNGAGTVSITSPTQVVTPVVLGSTAVSGRYTSGTGKAAGTVTGTIRKHAGNSRRFYIFIWTDNETTDSGRNITISLSSGETLTKIGADIWLGNSFATNQVVFSGVLSNSVIDEDITLTVNHGVDLWSWAAVAVTVGSASGEELYVQNQSFVTPKPPTISKTITPAGNKRLVLFAASIVGGGGSPATTSLGTIVQAGNTGGTRSPKDLSYIVVADQVEVAATKTYIATFLVSDHRTSAVLAVQPATVSGATILAPGNLVSIKDRYGVATVVMTGDGNIYIEGEMA